MAVPQLVVKGTWLRHLLRSNILNVIPGLVPGIQGYILLNKLPWTPGMNPGVTA